MLFCSGASQSNASWRRLACLLVPEPVKRLSHGFSCNFNQHFWTPSQGSLLGVQALKPPQGPRPHSPAIRLDPFVTFVLTNFLFCKMQQNRHSLNEVLQDPFVFIAILIFS